jgi:hypothetical protein
MNKEILQQFFYYKEGKLYNKVTRNSRSKKDQESGNINVYGYRDVMFNHKTYKVHRLIFMMFYGYMPKEIDHIDGNSSNNRIENLRECSSSQNKYNTKLRIDNKSGIKGVSWSKTNKKWHAYLNCDGKRLNIGFFKNIQEAKNAVKSYRIKQHDVFARHQ